MLSDDQRKRIEAAAIAQMRQQWGRTSPRRLGDVVAEVRTRMAEGTWGQQTFAERLDDLARLAHETDVYTRDEPEQARDKQADRTGPERGD